MIKRRIFQIQFVEKIVDTYLYVTSRNEINYNQQGGVTLEELVVFLRNIGPSIMAVIIPFRSSNLVNSIFAETYIKLLNNEGFPIYTLVMFNTAVNLPSNFDGELLISN